MNIITQGEDVTNLDKLQIRLIEMLVEHFELSDTVLLNETIHGHIVDIEKVKFFERDRGVVARLNVEDINLITDLMNDYGDDGLRWVEVYKDKIKVGL